MGLKKRFFASFSIRIIALMDNSSVGAELFPIIVVDWFIAKWCLCVTSVIRIKQLIWNMNFS